MGYGETAFECGEPLYYYGRALLDLARMEAGVIDNVMDGEESEEDSKDGDSQDGEEDEDKENGEEEEEAADGEDGKDDSIQGDGAEKEDVAATEKEDEEEPSTLQQAWEMLELAKNILMKQSESLKDTDKEKKSLVDSRICDTYQTLGEVSIENENYQQAIDDLETCSRKTPESSPKLSTSLELLKGSTVTLTAPSKASTRPYLSYRSGWRTSRRRRSLRTLQRPKMHSTPGRARSRRSNL